MIEFYDEASEAYAKLRKEHAGNHELLGCVGVIYRLKKEIEAIERECEKLRSIEAEGLGPTLVVANLAAAKLIKAAEQECAIWQAAILIEELPEESREAARDSIFQKVSPQSAEMLVAECINTLGSTDARKIKKFLDAKLRSKREKITEEQILATEAHQGAKRGRAPRGSKTYQYIDDLDSSTVNRLRRGEEKS